MYLAQAFRLKSRVATAFNMADNSNLKAWYKFKTGITVDGNNDVSLWADSSNNTTQNMDIAPAGADNDVAYNASTGALTFATVDKSFLITAGDELNLGAFTIFGVIDVTESGAANEAVIGRAGNDEFRLYRGGGSNQARLRANGVNYDLNLSSSLPTGKFLFTVSRSSSGSINLRIDSNQEATTSSDVTNLFDFTRVGNGATDSIMYEIAIYDVELNSTLRDEIEANIKTRNGL
jgi:hypothetical protein